MKNYLVTGASYGLGNAIGRAIVLRGDNLVSISRTEAKLPGKHRWIECDFENKHSLHRLELPDCAFDGVIMNAALADKTVVQFEVYQIVRYMKINFFGVIRLWERLEEEGRVASPCNVVLLSSFLQNGNAQQPAYDASKAALWSWMRSYTMAQKANHPVSMNMIWPGRVITPANPKRKLPENDVNHFREPEEIVPTVLRFLDQPAGGPRGTVTDMGRS